MQNFIHVSVTYVPGTLAVTFWEQVAIAGGLASSERRRRRRGFEFTDAPSVSRNIAQRHVVEFLRIRDYPIFVDFPANFPSRLYSRQGSQTQQ